MASKPRNRASIDAAAVARMMAEQDQAEQEAPAADPAPAEASVPAPAESPPVTPVIEAAPPPPVAPLPAEPPAWDPGKVDGRTLRRTGREPFATRIKPETHEALRRIAYQKRITMAEALEMAVAAFDRS
ncbi:hypothetical protein ADL19_04900 [Streptomyces purpurogeneiscleroticus]|nr:hypothetical protein ADL19_04900 [Streptomyces purpurogeneiscleroticus]